MKIRFSALSGILLCGLALAWSSAAVAVTITPSSVTINEGATQQFKASVSSTWKTNCGSISSTGFYRAGVYEGTCIVTATAGSQQATATVTVKTPIVMTPRTTQTPQGKTQQFTASVPVTWHTKCGAISASGLYTASGTVGQQCSIWAIAASGTAYTVYGWDQITAPGPPPSFSLSPATAAVLENGTQQFTASASSTWTASCGSISSSGLYKANLYEGSCTVSATAGSQKATATVTVTSPIVMTPRTVLTPQGKTQQFTANVPVTWFTRCGSISTSGLYTATGTVGQQCSTWAVATGSPAYTVYGWDRTGAPGSLSLYPASVAVPEGASQQFTAGAPASWSASCGIIALSSGNFTAPYTPGTCTVVATALDGSGKTATANASVTSPITLTPAALHTHALGQQHFTANVPVQWSASCGAIDSAGNFTAPSTAAPRCSITATASSGPAYSSQAAVLVTVVNYTTWKNSNARDGLQADEQILTPANVNSTSFGPAWFKTLDGAVWDQPLYMNALTVNGTPHNVVFAGTSNDTIYALDADTGAQLWMKSLLVPASTAVPGASVGFSQQIGILSTPVIDPISNTLYAVAETAESNNTLFVHRLHALDITTGVERAGSPVVISDPALVPIHKLQRPGLLLANHQVYVAFGSINDLAPYNGLLFAFDAGTLKQTALFNVTPNGSEGALWNSGAAPSADADGNLYIATGNGSFNGTNNFGSSVVKLSPTLEYMDFFAPFDQAYDNGPADLDLGSGGVLLTPVQNGPYPNEIVTCGKATPIFVLNRDNLGHVGTTSDNIIQRLDKQLGTGTNEPCFSTPAMWQQHVYFVANADVMKMFDLNPATGQLSATPVAEGAYKYGYPGAQSVVSTGDNNQQGIVWTSEFGTGTLLANDAVTLNQLYQSPPQDTGVKFTVPTVVNGHVYAGYKSKIVAFSTH